MLAASIVVGVVSTAAMTTIDAGEWRWAIALFMVGNMAVAASLVFYDSLLPHIAAPAELDRVSTAGYALGYLGGGILLAANLVFYAYWSVELCALLVLVGLWTWGIGLLAGRGRSRAWLERFQGR